MTFMWKRERGREEGGIDEMSRFNLRFEEKCTLQSPSQLLGASLLASQFMNAMPSFFLIANISTVSFVGIVAIPPASSGGTKGDVAYTVQNILFSNSKKKPKEKKRKRNEKRKRKKKKEKKKKET